MTRTPISEASIEGSTVQYVERSEYYKVLKSWDLEKKIRADHLQQQIDSFKAKHERLLEALTMAEASIYAMKKHCTAPDVQGNWAHYFIGMADEALAQIESLK